MWNYYAMELEKGHIFTSKLIYIHYLIFSVHTHYKTYYFEVLL